MTGPAGSCVMPEDYVTEVASEPVVLQRLGRAVRQHRLRTCRTKEALAREIGISVHTLEHIERGTGNPSLLLLHSISEKLGLPLSELFKGP